MIFFRRYGHYWTTPCSCTTVLRLDLTHIFIVYEVIIIVFSHIKFFLAFLPAITSAKDLWAQTPPDSVNVSFPWWHPLSRHQYFLAVPWMFLILFVFLTFWCYDEANLFPQHLNFPVLECSSKINKTKPYSMLFVRLRERKSKIFSSLNVIAIN